MNTVFARTLIGSFLIVVVLVVSPLVAVAQDEIVTGLGEGSNGWSEFREDTTDGHVHLAWRQLPWGAYNASGCDGETRAAAGNIDGGGFTEVIYGLGPCANGWFELREDAGLNYAHLAWRYIDWTAYNNCNGETWPASGNLDNTDNDEIVLGLGSCANGWFEIRHDSTGSYSHQAWRQVPWSEYNSRNGETRPAVGDLNGGGEAEIVIGLGRTGFGYFEIRDGAAGNYNHLAWRQIPWTSYNNNCGATRPAVGDIDGDNRDEIVIGLAGYELCGDNHGHGWFAIYDDATTNYAFLRWERVNWTEYNNCVGETRPAIGDLDGGGFEEIVIGFGTKRTCGTFYYPNGWYEVFDDASANFNHKAWLQVNWPAYYASNGETWPAVGDSITGLATSSETGEEPMLSEEHAQSEPAPGPAIIMPSTLHGPPSDLVQASEMIGPIFETGDGAGPTAMEIDPALAPPLSSTVYEGPIDTGVYYPGPDGIALPNKLFLPLMQAR